MSENPRHSGETVVAGGSATVETVLESRDDAPFRANSVVVDYAGAADTTVEIHESPDGTAAGDLDSSTLRKTLFVAGDERVTLTGISMRDFQTDVLVNPDGNQDGDLAVFVGGKSMLSTREQ